MGIGCISDDFSKLYFNSESWMESIWLCAQSCDGGFHGTRHLKKGEQWVPSLASHTALRTHSSEMCVERGWFNVVNRMPNGRIHYNYSLVSFDNIYLPIEFQPKPNRSDGRRWTSIERFVGKRQINNYYALIIQIMTFPVETKRNLLQAQRPHLSRWEKGKSKLLLFPPGHVDATSSPASN